MPCNRYIIIEHLEPCISPWLLCEYRYVADLFKGRLIFSNVKEDALEVLSNYGMACNEDFINVITKLSLKNVIILDPQAEYTLTPSELMMADGVVIGGIMGDHPPRGRTKELISSKARGQLIRNLGKKQLTVAGTAYVIKKLEEGRSLNELDIREGLKVEMKLGDAELTIELPYMFPYEDGRPVVPEGYIEVILYGSQLFETNPCLHYDQEFNG